MPPPILPLFVRPALLAALLALGGCAGLEAPAADAAGLDGPRGPALPVEARSVEVSGRFLAADRGRPPRGAYGLRVALLFRRSDASGWDGAAQVPGAPRRGRHYDVVREDGTFRFALSTAVDLRAYDEVAVVPVAEGPTVELVPHPRGGVGLDDGTTAFPLEDAVRAPLPAAGPVRVEGLEATVRPEVGVVVRWAELAREFVTAFYGGDVPFELPPVRVELARRGGFVFQSLDPDALFLGGHEIELNAARGVTPTIVAHEVGHYVAFRMWGASPLRYALRARDLREGWAIFFSFAVRSYAAARYGDVDLAPSNPERAPFTDVLGRGARYEGIAYGHSRPGNAAIAALLWSLYDGADPSPFEASRPDAGGLDGDNDDVSGHARDLVEAVRLARTSVLDEVGVREVVRDFRARVPAGLGPSVDGAADFFLCPAFPDCDVKAPAAPTLRPVAPAGLEARRVAPGAVALAWDRRVTAAPWANAPTAYRVLRDGETVATLPGDASAWVDVEAGPGARRYEVRAVGPAGEAFGSPSAEAPAAGARLEAPGDQP